MEGQGGVTRKEVCLTEDKRRGWEVGGEKWELGVWGLCVRKTPKVLVGKMILVGLCMAAHRVAGLLGAAGKCQAWAH